MSNPEAASLCDAARQFAARAISLDTRHQFADAKEAYTNAAESLIKAVSVEPDVRTREVWRAKAFEYVRRAETIRDMQLGRRRPTSETDAAAPADSASASHGTGHPVKVHAPPHERPIAAPQDAAAKPPRRKPRGRNAGSARITGAASAQDMDSYLTREPTQEGELTHVQSMFLEAGGRTFVGEFVVDTASLQTRLRALLKPGQATTSTPAATGSDHEDKPVLAGGGEDGIRPAVEDAAADRPALPPSAAIRAEAAGGFAGASAPSRPAPPAVGANGTIKGARPDFHQDTAVQTPSSRDSGTYYRGNEWEDLVRKPKLETGPAQRPYTERVSLEDRARQIRSASREATRVNPASQQRGYAIDGYEEHSYIDEGRSLDQPLPRGAKTGKASAAVTHSSVLWETAAVGAKLRNAHKVGGERVKEMDHFVASVETPRVSVKLPDVAPIVARVLESGLLPIPVPDCRDDVTGDTVSLDLHVQPELRGAGNSVSANVHAHAAAFYRVLSRVLRDFLQRADMLETMRVYYMATIRADACVCSKSAVDGRVYFNLLAFQQQEPLKPNGGQPDGPIPRRTWLYWLQRAAIVLAEDGKPTGMYDPSVRARFHAFIGSATEPTAPGEGQRVGA